MSGFRALMTPQWVSILGGWRALGFALCALVAMSWGALQHLVLLRTRVDLAHYQANVAGWKAERDAALALAADYGARAEKARADLAEATKALERQSAARARKWERIAQAEPVWSETPVPEQVVEGLR